MWLSFIIDPYSAFDLCIFKFELEQCVDNAVLCFMFVAVFTHASSVSVCVVRRITENVTKKRKTTTWMIRWRQTRPGANTSCWMSPSLWHSSRASSSPPCSVRHATVSLELLRPSCTCRCLWLPPASAHFRSVTSNICLRQRDSAGNMLTSAPIFFFSVRW